MSNGLTQAFTARVLLNIDSQIRIAHNTSERNILFAQKAFILARHSQIPEAREIVRELRRINSNYEDPRLSAWIMFSEGVIEYSDTMAWIKSKDRIFRAHLVGQVVNDPTLAGTSAAWLAQFTLLEEKFTESRDYLVKAFSWTKITDNEARSRACMVIGMAFLLAGELQKARAWMQQARNHAVASGDIAMQNIILYNTAAFQAAQLMLLDCTTSVDPAELQFAVMSAQSAGNLNFALGISNQPSMVPVQRAELFTIEKKWAEAIKLFDSYIDTSDAQGQAKWAAKFYAQRAWCKANLADFEGCKRDLQFAIQDTNQSSDADDLAIVHFRVAASARLMHDDKLSDFHQAMGEKCLGKFREYQSEMNVCFSALTDSLTNK